MLISVVFLIVNTCLGLSTTLSQVQRTSRRAATAEVQLENLFNRLPSTAQLSITENDDGALSLSIENPGIYFPLNGIEQRAAIARFDLIETSDEINTLVLTCETESSDDSGEDVLSYSINLINTPGQLSWEVYSQSTNEWTTEWTGERPTIIRLHHDEDNSENTPSILTNFWIPPRTATSQRRGNRN